MSEVLSQSEIDALLNALNAGEVDAKDIEEDTQERKVKNYDFRNPQKMAKDQLRTLEIIHDNFARLLQTSLSGYLRAPVKIAVLTVDQYAYSEFSNAISNPAFLSIVNFNPLPGEIILDLSSKIAMVIIDRLLGGSGEKVEEVRVFTDIELTLLRTMMNRIIDLIAEAWSNVIELNPKLEKIETNPQFAQIVSSNETIALITLNISIGEIEGMLNICIPHIVIESILSKLSTKLWFTKSKAEDSSVNYGLIEQRLKNAYVILKAELGNATLTVNELVNLQPGDVVKIDTLPDNEATIKIGTKMKFFCQPGSIGKKVAMKVTRVKKEGEDTDD